MTISKETAQQIAYAYREVETAEGLLAEITELLAKHRPVDIRDAFGRQQNGLELGVPSSRDSRRLFNVPWTLARPIIETHIASQRALISALSEKARGELEAGAISP